MSLLTFQPHVSAGPDGQRPIPDGVEVTLAAREHLAFSTSAQSCEIQIRRGQVWLTDGPIDHLLADFQSHICPPRSRVVVTALSDVVLRVRHAAVR